MIYTDIRTTDHHDGIRRTELIFGYSRKPKQAQRVSKYVITMIVVLFLFAVSIAVLRATDVPDTKPTINVTGGW